MIQVEERIISIFLTEIDNLDNANIEDIVELMAEIKQDGEKV